MTHESALPSPDLSAPEQHESATFEYELLVGHKRTDGSFKSTEELQSEYVELTDRLIHTMTDGVMVKNHETGEREKRPVDAVVWLDKSARPVSWLTRELWPVLAADKDGQVPPMPDFKYVNIDRNQWTMYVDPNGVGASDIDKLDKSIIRSLRSIFLRNPHDKRDGLTERIDTAESVFNDKVVLVVDEVQSSGRTLSYATRFFERAFPEAHVAGAHWMKGMVQRGQARGNADLPVWYSDTTVLGRGIGNRNIDLSQKSGNTTQKLGAYFLSTALRAPDPLSQQLRSELHHLAEDFKQGKVFVMPSVDRDDADADERAVRYNHLSSFAEYVALAQEHQHHKQ